MRSNHMLDASVYQFSFLLVVVMMILIVVNYGPWSFPEFLVCSLISSNMSLVFLRFFLHVASMRPWSTKINASCWYQPRLMFFDGS